MKPLRIDDLIYRLEKLRNVFGDLEVYIEMQRLNRDTTEAFPITSWDVERYNGRRVLFLNNLPPVHREVAITFGDE